jgi:hypothetical protein
VLGAGSQTLSVTFTPTNTADYTTAQSSVTLAVNPANLSVTAKNASMSYGAVLPAFTYNLSGFMNGDTAATALSGAPSLTTTATSASSVGTYPITAAIGSLAAANYTFVFNNGTLIINNAPLVAAATNISVTYGSAIPALTYTLSGFLNGDTQASATSGSPALSTTATDISFVGSYPITIGAGTLAAANYSFNLKNGAVTVKQAMPAISWSNPAAISYGTPLSAAQLDANSPVAGGFAYTPNFGAVLNYGSHTLYVTFTPNDTENNTSNKATATLMVTQASQTITFTPLPGTVVYGVSPMTLSASSSAGLTVTLSVVSGPATISGSMLKINGAGNVVVAANQTGNSNYAAAAEVKQTIVVNQATPSITLKSSGSSIKAGSSVTFTATLTGNSIKPSGTVTFFDGAIALGTATLNSSGVATYATTALAAGPHSISATYNSDTNYFAASSTAIGVTGSGP